MGSQSILPVLIVHRADCNIHIVEDIRPEKWKSCSTREKCPFDLWTACFWPVCEILCCAPCAQHLVLSFAHSPFALLLTAFLEFEARIL